MEEGLGLLAQDEFHQGAWNRIEMGNLIHASFQRAPHQEGRGNISGWRLQLAQWHHHHAPPHPSSGLLHLAAFTIGQAALGLSWKPTHYTSARVAAGPPVV